MYEYTTCHLVFVVGTIKLVIISLVSDENFIYAEGAGFITVRGHYIKYICNISPTGSPQFFWERTVDKCRLRLRI